MYRTILVPLDGTIFSERAIPLASTIARATDGRLILVRAAWAPDRPGLDPLESQQWAVREARTYLENVARELMAQGLRVETDVPFALADVGILREIAVRHADLVVMSSHRKPTRQHQIYGSVAEAILARSPAPVVVIRTEEHVHVSPKPASPELIVPLDGSTFAESALPFAVELAKALRWSITLMQAITEPTLRGMTANAYLEEEAEAVSYLAGIASRLRREGVQVKTAVKAGPAPQAILDVCQRQDASMIVMASHGRTGVREMMFGSVTMEIMRHTDTPLFLVRPMGLTERRPVKEEPERELAGLVPSR